MNKEQVEYIADASGYYCAESSALVRKYCEKNIFPLETLFLSDGGPAWGRKGDSVMTAEKGCKHLRYPSEVHHLLSPNDNNFHGGAKRKWRLDRALDWGKDEEISLSLLHHLSQDNETNVKKYFENNFFLSNYRNLTLKKCKDIVRHGLNSFVEKKNFFEGSKKTL